MALDSLMTSTVRPDEAAGWSGKERAGNFTSQNGCRITSLRVMREAGSLARQRESKSLNAAEHLSRVIKRVGGETGSILGQLRRRSVHDLIEKGLEIRTDVRRAPFATVNCRLNTKLQKPPAGV